MANDFPIPSAKKMRLSTEYPVAPSQFDDGAEDIDDIYGYQSPLRQDSQPSVPLADPPSTLEKLPDLKPAFSLPGLGFLADSGQNDLSDKKDIPENLGFIGESLPNGAASLGHNDQPEPASEPQSSISNGAKEGSVKEPDLPVFSLQSNVNESGALDIQRSTQSQFEGQQRMESDPLASSSVTSASIALQDQVSYKESSTDPAELLSITANDAMDMDHAELSLSNGDTKQQSANGLGSKEEPPVSRSGNEVPVLNASPGEIGGEQEVEHDSSPYESSSDDTSDSSSEDDSDDSGDEGYELLDPAEQARRLMEDDGGSDDEGHGKANAGAPVRTLNEKPDEVVRIPDIEITQDMQTEELGNVETTIDSLALIKAKTTGEYQVLESGSLLCLESRSVIGVVAETLGRVQQPLYSVRFTNASSMASAGICTGTTIFYVPQHSTFVFTKALQSVKGSDASNIHDEEVGAEELEFSDDEAEAQHKRMKKLQRQEKKGGRGGFGRGRGYFMANGGGQRHYAQEMDVSTLQYEDSNASDEPYIPLIRPSNLNDLQPPGAIPAEYPQEGYSRAPRGMRGGGRGYQGRGIGRGRGDRKFRPNDRSHSARTNPDLSLPPVPTFATPSNQQPSYHHPAPYSMNAPSALPHQSPNTNGAYGHQNGYPNSYQNGHQNGYTVQSMGPFNQAQSTQFPSYPAWPQNQNYPAAQQPVAPPNFQQPPNPQASRPYPAFPPGAFINPAFFANQPQSRQG
ncbi:hypothetical protein MMC10_010306 [Thelotrema lepadinum]|nr:hypothetical protein [Thelotrema lepadinum]